MKKSLIIFVFLTFTWNSCALALPPCNVLLQLDLDSPTGLVETPPTFKERVNDIRRTFSITRYLMNFHKFDRTTFEELISRYQNNPAGRDAWMADFQKRLFEQPEFGQKPSWKPEEWFAYLELARPEQIRKFVEALAEDDGLYVRTRGILLSWLTNNRPDVIAMTTSISSMYTFPKRVKPEDFDRANAVFFQTMLRANFKDPSTLATLSHILQAMGGAFFAKYIARDYRNGDPAVIKTAYEALIHELFDSQVNRREMLVIYRDSLEHPELIDQWLTDLPAPDREILEKNGRDFYLNYLAQTRGRKEALKFLRHVVVKGLIVSAMTTIVRFYLPGGLSYIIRHGRGIKPGGTPTPQQLNQAVLDSIDSEHLSAGPRWPYGTFDPLEWGYVGDVPVDLNVPDGPKKINPCDPQRAVQKQVQQIFSHMTEDEFNQSPQRDQWLNQFRQSINKYWNDPNSGCRSSYKAWHNAYDQQSRQPSSVTRHGSRSRTKAHE